MCGALRTCVLALILCVCASRGQTEGWLNPSDIHTYDHVNKMMREQQKQDNIPSVSNAPLHECRSTLHKLQTSTQGQEFTYDFLLGKLQRQTSFILQAADLLEESTEGDTLYVQRHMMLTLSHQQLMSLRKFAQTGKLEAEAVDDAWRDMWTLVESPGHSRWAWPDLPSVDLVDNKERVILVLGLAAVVLPMLLLMLRVSLLRVFLIFVLLLFTVSVVFRYHRITQDLAKLPGNMSREDKESHVFGANEMRQRHMLTDPMQMPSECRPYNRTRWETFKHFFSSDVYDAQKCSRYYEATFTDPLTQTTPLEQMTQVLLDVWELASERMGSALRNFSDSVFADLPWPLNLVAGTVTKLACVVLFIVIFLVMTWFCVKESFFTMLRGGFRRRSVHQDAGPRERSASHFHITNHGPLVFGNATSGIEILDSVRGRAQSESSIQFSSQSVGQSEQGMELSLGQSQPRLRSASDSQVKPIDRSRGRRKSSVKNLEAVSEDLEERGTREHKFASIPCSFVELEEHSKPQELDEYSKHSPLNDEVFASQVCVCSEKKSQSKSDAGSLQYFTSNLDNDCREDAESIEKVVHIPALYALSSPVDATVPGNLDTKSPDSSPSLYSTPVRSPSSVMDCDVSLSPSQSELSTFLETLNLDESISELLQSPVSAATQDSLLESITAELATFEVVDSADKK